MRRVLEPELLDSLPPGNRSAIRSRADLQRVNWWMRNEVHVWNAISKLPQFPRSILEIGAGDGNFMLRLAKRFQGPNSRPVKLTLLDKEPVVSEKTLSVFRELNWKATIMRDDVLRWSSQPDGPEFDLVVANLFLHHFTELDLAKIFRKVALISRFFVACEPRRWKASLLGTRLLWLIACNHVTRHDARVSVCAGFNGTELSALWPYQGNFRVSEEPAGFASHLFVVIKTAGDPF